VEWLVERGIPARILNANASSLAGELPLDHATPQVWVDNDVHAARAREFIDQYLNGTKLGPPLTCAHCGEENPSSFEVCWSCGQPLASSP
jgi:hypothetical protein